VKPNRSWIGVVSTLSIASLLVVAAVAPRAIGRAPALPGVLAHPSCDLILQQSDGNQPLPLNYREGVVQPIAPPANVAACSLTVDPTYNYGFARLNLVQWDPVSLMPDPATVALRTVSFSASPMPWNPSRAEFYPPVVTKSLPNVAERPGPVAIDWRSEGGYVTMRFNNNGPAEAPTALRYPSGGGASTPLSGEHPVLSHAVCGGDRALQDLQVVQSVMTTTVLSDTDCFELIQRFRVPVLTRLRWIEVAFGVNPHPIYFDPVMAIVDAAGQSEPPVTLPPSLIEAPYAYFVSAPFWGSHFDFDHYITLEPEHDYWLLVRVEHRYFLYSRLLTGGESQDFTANIGPSFKRTAFDSNWIPNRGRALCFRLIGEPLARQMPHGRLRPRPLGEATPDGRMPQPSIATPTDPSRSAALSLRVAPNPARGASFVSWSGAAGALRIEVMDAQGRLVAANSGRASAAGQWLWSGARDDGRPLPAGVYFVRGTDAAGRVASDRVVLIR
jgi:hypothetical protein